MKKYCYIRNKFNTLVATLQRLSQLRRFEKRYR